jgi:NADP-dependent 3-hydroxy acid dehydrogenase YdfG
MAPKERYIVLANSLLAAPDPVYAIAHELGDQAGRIAALARRLDAVEQLADHFASQLRLTNESHAHALESAS